MFKASASSSKACRSSPAHPSVSVNATLSPRRYTQGIDSVLVAEDGGADDSDGDGDGDGDGGCTSSGQTLSVSLKASMLKMVSSRNYRE